MMDELLKAVEVVQNYWGPGPAIYESDERAYSAACELLARWLVANAGELVRVKGLEWYTDNVAFTIFGAMVVTESELVLSSVVHPGIVKLCGCDSLADGKAKAERWHRSRLAVTLEPIFEKDWK